MNIAAIQKTTLLDYPGRIACTVFLPGCNLRCPFCHNAGLVLPEQIPTSCVSQEEFLSFLDKRKGKLDGVCITGGEPTLYENLPELMEKIHHRGFLVKLDTNGTNPRMLRRVIGEGLADYVAMDIKNSPQRYKETCGGVDVLNQVRESAAILLSEAVDCEFRTTVFHPLHTPDSLKEIGKWLRGAKRYYLQCFVDSGNLVGQGISPLTQEETEELRQAVLEYIPATQIRGM